jgi:galactose mutarotase-like enzyme
MVIYAPLGEDLLCLERVSHVDDGFNLLERGVEGAGVHVLPPGQTLAGTIRFRVA